MSLSSLSSRVTDVETKSVALSPIYGLFDTPVMPLADALARALKGETELGDLRDILAKYGGDFELNIYTAEMALEHWRKSPDWKTDPLRDDPQGAMAIHCYTQESAVYPLLNQRLRNADRSKLKSAWFPFLRLLLCAALRLPVSDTPTLYRGVKLDLHAECTKDSRLTWWAFSSCTSNVEVLQNDMFLGTKGERTMFAITASGRSIKNYSAIPKEDELLLLPGTVLKVGGTLNMGSSLFTIQLQEQSMNMIADIKKLKEEVSNGSSADDAVKSPNKNNNNNNESNNNDIETITADAILHCNEEQLGALLQKWELPKKVVAAMADYNGKIFLKPNFFALTADDMQSAGVREIHLEELRALHERLLSPPPMPWSMPPATALPAVAPGTGWSESMASIRAAQEAAHGELMRAVEAGNAEGVVVALEQAPVARADSSGVTPLYRAAELGHVDVVRALLATGRAEVNATMTRTSFDRSTALHGAAENGHVKVIEQLIAAGADVNVADEGDCTPVFVATKGGHAACVRLLARQPGVNLDREQDLDAGGGSALSAAAEAGHEQIVALLVEAGAEVDCDDLYETALIRAAKSGHASIVSLLLRAGAAPAIRDLSDDSRTALEWAREKGHTEVVKLLEGQWIR